MPNKRRGGELSASMPNDAGHDHDTAGWRASFVSAKDLVAKITTFVDAYNAKSRPFVRTATSDAILAKVTKICNVINETQH